MRPSGQVALDLGPPYEDGEHSDSDFEQIPHPSHNTHWAQHPPAHAAPREEQLPLHYMSEEKARRRVTRGPGGNGVYADPIAEKGLDYDAFDDDEGKDVYSKMKVSKGGPISSGRPRRPPPPPPTTVVRRPLAHIVCSMHSLTTPALRHGWCRRH